MPHHLIPACPLNQSPGFTVSGSGWIITLGLLVILRRAPCSRKDKVSNVATEQGTVDFIVDQLAPLPVRAKAMFGEYALYCDEKVVALICDDTLFVKPTAISGDFLDESALAPPYPRAKDHYAVPGDRLEDREWLQALIARTAELVPAAKKKAAKPRN